MADDNGTVIKINWSKIVAWVASTLFALLLATCLFVFKLYAGKIDTIEGQVNKLVTAVEVLQTQNTSTATQISDIKESVKEVRADVKELSR